MPTTYLSGSGGPAIGSILTGEGRSSAGGFANPLGKSKVLPGVRLIRSGLLPNGAPLDVIVAAQGISFHADLPPDYLLTAGHLIHRKGIDTVIAALQLAKDRGVVLQLVVAGDGPERENLMRQSHEQGVSDQIRFVGNQSQPEVLSLMRSCLFFVLASRAEGMPLVIAEAMASGKPLLPAMWMACRKLCRAA